MAKAVQVKADVTVSAIQIDNVNCVVTVINDGTVSSLTGYTGKALLKSGGGSYGRIVNNDGSVGDFLYRESAAKFCYYRTTAGQWLRPEQATESCFRRKSSPGSP